MPCHASTQIKSLLLITLISASGAASSLSPERIFKQASPSVVTVYAVGKSTNSQGSGVVVSKGMVLTNCHVLTGATVITVVSGKTLLPATLAEQDLPRDLCSLYVDGLAAPPAEIAKSSAARIGQCVYAIGSPRGLSNTLPDGLLSAIRQRNSNTLLQTAAPIT